MPRFLVPPPSFEIPPATAPRGAKLQPLDFETAAHLVLKSSYFGTLDKMIARNRIAETIAEQDAAVWRFQDDDHRDLVKAWESHNFAAGDPSALMFAAGFVHFYELLVDAPRKDPTAKAEEAAE